MVDKQNHLFRDVTYRVHMLNVGSVLERIALLYVSCITFDFMTWTSFYLITAFSVVSSTYKVAFKLSSQTVRSCHYLWEIQIYDSSEA